MTVNFPPWKPFVDFPFQSYSCFRLTAQKVFPLPTVGAPSASNSPSALSACGLCARAGIVSRNNKMVVADKDTVSGEIRRWSVTDGKCIGCGADFYNNFDLAFLVGQQKFNNLPWRPTHPCQNHLYQHSPPWWLMIMLTFSAVFTQLVVFHGIKYESSKAGNSALPCLPWSPTHPALLQPGSLGGLHYIEMACSPDKGDVVVIYSDVFPFPPESMLLEMTPL